jgi:hypothetical protein
VSYIRRISGQVSVQGIGKLPFVAVAELGGTATMYATAAHGIHKISHIQPRLDGTGRIFLSPRAESFSAFANDLIGKWYVTCNHQVPGLYAAYDLIVGDIETLCHLNCLDMFDWRRLQGLIRE